MARPAMTIPTCATCHSARPPSGPTCVDHFHPGSSLARPTVRPPSRTTSNVPFSNDLVSSGAVNRLRSTGSIVALHKLKSKVSPGVGTSSGSRINERSSTPSNEFFSFQIEHGYGQTQFSARLRHLVQPGFQQRKDLLFVLWIDHLSPAL